MRLLSRFNIRRQPNKAGGMDASFTLRRAAAASRALSRAPLIHPPED